MARGQISIGWTGLIELKQQLGAIPANLLASSAGAVAVATNQAAASLRASYPTGPTGNLRRGVRTSIKTTDTGTVGKVRSTAPHSHLWEFGTKPRRWKRNGKSVGTMPAQYNQGVVGVAIRERRILEQQLIAQVRNAGFTVNGV